MNKLAASRIDGPVIHGSRRMIYFLLPPKAWSFKANETRDQLLCAVAARYAELTGRRIHMRVTSRPYPVEQWARELDENTPSCLPAWPEFLISEQIAMLDLTLADTLTYVGVELHENPTRGAKYRDEIREVTDIMAAEGTDAAPVTPQQFEFLMHRSCSLGAPASTEDDLSRETWEPTDMVEFTERANWSAVPFAQSVKVDAIVNGVKVTRAVRVLTMTRLREGIEIPSGEPWITRANRLFPVEWSIIADVVPPDKTKKEMRDTILAAKSQTEHYEKDHHIPAPRDLARQFAKALRGEEDVDVDPIQTRVNCWVRAAIPAATEREAITKGDRFTKAYKPDFTFEAGKAQHSQLREFIPGEPLSNTAHCRRLTVVSLAAALPTVTSTVGQRNGFHIGSTDGAAPRAALWNTHHAMEVDERSGGCILAAEPGGGKSTLMGTLAYWSCLAGVRTAMLDPAGPLGLLSTMPELAGFARTVNLMDAEPGVLGPWRVISDPRRENHLAPRAPGSTHDEWAYECDLLYQRAMRAAQAARQTLAEDAFLALLPAGFARENSTADAIHNAIQRVGGSVDTDGREVLDVLLASDDDRTRTVGTRLRNISDTAQAALLFGDRDRPTPIDTTDYMLQVFTMPGLTFPDVGSDRRDWQADERMSVALLLLAARLTAQHIYNRPMAERKLLLMDELNQIVGIPSGRTLVNKGFRDSRKWNLRFIAGMQNVSDIKIADVGNLVSDVLGGHTEDPDAQAALCQVARIPTGVGYERVFGKLRPTGLRKERDDFRTMIWSDGQGNIERVRIHRPERLRRYLDTTANPFAAAQGQA